MGDPVTKLKHDSIKRPSPLELSPFNIQTV
jgi:hypothetical protein